MHYCNMVRWAMVRLIANHHHPPLVLWRCWFGNQTCRTIVSEMTYCVALEWYFKTPALHRLLNSQQVPCCFVIICFIRRSSGVKPWCPQLIPSNRKFLPHGKFLLHTRKRHIHNGSWQIIQMEGDSFDTNSLGLIMYYCFFLFLITVFIVYCTLIEMYNRLWTTLCLKKGPNFETV